MPSDDNNNDPPKTNYAALYCFIAIISLAGVCLIVGFLKRRKPKEMFAKTTEVRKKKSKLLVKKKKNK
jgi:hypothetical protein